MGFALSAPCWVDIPICSGCSKAVIPRSCPNSTSCFCFFIFFWHDSLLKLNKYLLSNYRDDDLACIRKFGHIPQSLYITSPFYLQRAETPGVWVFPFSLRPVVFMCPYLSSSLPSLSWRPDSLSSLPSFVLVGLREFEISWSLGKVVLECKYILIIGFQNNLRSGNVLLSCKHVTKTFLNDNSK